jgi:hypothetical protein
MSKHSFKNVNYFDAAVSADVQTPAIDCYLMDTASFIMSFGIGVACSPIVEGSIDGVEFVDIGVVIEPVDGVAAANRFASFPVNLSYVRINLSSVTGSGQVTIKAQAKGFA